MLTADVIARVDLVGTRTSVAQRPEFWVPLVEFRFRVHEYLKGSGPGEIGGLVYRIEHDGFFWDTREQALAGAANMLAAHDSRWDEREAIVFLWSEDWQGSDLVEPGPGQYWFGTMAHHDSRGINEAYSVASIHKKAWLPEASQPIEGAAGSPDDKLFLIDVPLATTAAAGGGGTTTTATTMSLGELRNKIDALEAEANAGGTSEYRECVEVSYKYEDSLKSRVARRGPMPHRRAIATIGSGLPAGTILHDYRDTLGGLPDKVGLGWFEGPDKDVVQYADFDFRTWPDHIRFTRRVVTARPLPKGSYKVYPVETWYGGMVCAKYPELSRRYRVLYLKVTPRPGTLHEAFFDPVAFGAPAGADGTNRVLHDPVPAGTAFGADAFNGGLKAPGFAWDGATTTIEALWWQEGVVTLELSPFASLAGHAIDFIALDGSVSLTLEFDAAAQGGNGALAWSVPDQPWEAGDLLMLRIRAESEP